MRLSSFADGRVVASARFDLFVAASGYEARATNAAKAAMFRSTNRLALGFIEHATHPVRVENDRIFRELGFELEECSGDSVEEAAEAVVARLPDDVDTCRIAIDISSMTRAWYWGITKRLADLPNVRAIDMSFFYSPSLYSEPPTHQAAPKLLGPIPGISDRLELPDRPITLILGLGYEPDVAMGVVEYVDPQNTWAYYADPTTDPRFIKSVRQANRQLLSGLTSENVVTYPFDDPRYLFALLDSLLRGLVLHSRVIIAPLGPKPFALVAFLLSLVHPQVDVWRVSPGATGIPASRQPTGTVVECSVRFEA